jgi:hypothetical protein
MNGLLIIGIILVFAGLLGFAIPVCETRETEEVARIGDLTLQSTEDTSHRFAQERFPAKRDNSMNRVAF